MARKTTKPGAPVAANPPSEPSAPAADTLSSVSGSADKRFTNALLNAAIGACVPPNHPDRSTQMGAVLGAMGVAQPRDGVEGMLAAHLAALNSGALSLLRTANASGNSEQASRLRRDAMAAMRVFNETIGALQNWRGKTVRQHLVVERVLVQEGASIAIGAVDSAKND